MSEPNSSALVSTEWLAAHLHAPDVRVVDDAGRDVDPGQKDAGDRGDRVPFRALPPTLPFSLIGIADPASLVK